MRRFFPLVVPLLLILLGVGLDVAWQYLNGPTPIVFVRVDVGTLLLLLSILAALIALLAGVTWIIPARRGEREVAQGRAEAAASHQRFIRRLDHEIKNPLTAIRAGLANLDPADDAAVLKSVRVQVDRLARLSADLRKLADLETQPIEREPVQLGGLLTEVYEEAEAHDESGSRQLQLNLPRAPWPLPPVQGDRDLLFLAIHNLLDNALKYSRPGDTLELRASEDGANGVIEMADTGPGIPANEVPQVWEELYRGEGARGLPGSGLGLALVRAVVERHGGTVGVRSRAGQGTVFTIRLPLR